MPAKTHRNIVSVASAMFAWAVAEGLADENPVARARERFPRDLHRTDAEPFAPRALTDSELAAALAKAGKTYGPVIGFIAETGARVSEALAVRFDDVDVGAATWAVAGQLAADGTVRDTKTPGSMATVPLSQAAVAIVREQRSQPHAFADSTPPPGARSCSQAATGSRSVAATHSERGRRQRRTLGEPLRLHDLRTTLASRLAANRVDVPTAQALLRHARPSTTLDVYTRLQGDAAARLERMRKALDA